MEVEPTKADPPIGRLLCYSALFLLAIAAIPAMPILWTVTHPVSDGDFGDLALFSGEVGACMLCTGMSFCFALSSIEKGCWWAALVIIADAAVGYWLLAILK